LIEAGQLGAEYAGEFVISRHPFQGHSVNTPMLELYCSVRNADPENLMVAFLVI